jgi:hypothetical protein
MKMNFAKNEQQNEKLVAILMETVKLLMLLRLAQAS